jgi:hypothetical protein
MPGARLPMRKIRDMLRLTAAGMSSRKIAASLSIGGTTVVDCLQRARAVGVGWPLPEDLSDVALEARLFPASTALAAIKSRRTQAEWPAPILASLRLIGEPDTRIVSVRSTTVDRPGAGLAAEGAQRAL